MSATGRMQPFSARSVPQAIDRLRQRDIKLADIRRQQGDADRRAVARAHQQAQHRLEIVDELVHRGVERVVVLVEAQDFLGFAIVDQLDGTPREDAAIALQIGVPRSEEHTSELQSLLRISYAVFCLKKKTEHTN